jgi:hypothetical protein
LGVLRFGNGAQNPIADLQKSLQSAREKLSKPISTYLKSTPQVQQGHYLHKISIFDSKPDGTIHEVMLLAVKDGYRVALFGEGHRDITVDGEIAHPRCESSHTLWTKVKISRDFYPFFVLHSKTKTIKHDFLCDLA